MGTLVFFLSWLLLLVLTFIGNFKTNDGLAPMMFLAISFGWIPCALLAGSVQHYWL